MKLKIFRGLRIGKFYVILVLCVLIITLYGLVFSDFTNQSTYEYDVISSGNISLLHAGINKRFLYYSVEEYFNNRMNWETSNLGAILFKNNVNHFTPKNRTFVILIWRYFKWLSRRHIGDENDPFQGCSVNNCFLTGDDSKMDSADAVVVHVQKGVLPDRKYVNPSQRWVFLSDESPYNSFSMAGVRPTLRNWAGLFNWSMTYRSDSDIPVPYGRTISLREPRNPEKPITKLIPFWQIKRKDALATALISHCKAKRINVVKELRKHIKMDVYGSCFEGGNSSCPGHFRADCPVINKYIFYLAFENTQCRQYLTEKVFYNAYSKGAIPVIMGAPLNDCEKLLPPFSFLHVENYNSLKDLAEDMMRIANNEELLQMYHMWRNNFEVVNEHGYFNSKSYHFCRVCEALNYNDESPKVYNEDGLNLFFEPKILCTPEHT